MKLVFMGTPDFAVPSLKLLAKHFEVKGVITAPDRPAGRGKSLTPSAVKIVALELGLTILQPKNLKDPDFQSKLAALGADLFVVVAFRMLPNSVWTMPQKGTINLHASLLPQYRGAAPINRAIMNGETKTGLTTFFIDEQIDTGKILNRIEIEIAPDENAGSLHNRMMEAGADLLFKTIKSIETGKTDSKAQISVENLKAAPKIFKEDCEIIWNEPVAQIHNHIRGLAPYPGAWTPTAGVNYTEQDFKILHSRIASFQIAGQPGCVLLTDENRLFVKCGTGTLEVLELQVPGKKRMKTSDFLRGFNPPIDFRFFV